MVERQARVTENNNDSRYAPHDRQTNSRGQPWNNYQHYRSSGRANNVPPCNRGPSSHYRHRAENYQHYGSSGRANNAPPCNRGPSSHYRHRAENTVGHVQAPEEVGGASSDNKHRYSFCPKLNLYCHMDPKSEECKCIYN